MFHSFLKRKPPAPTPGDLGRTRIWLMEPPTPEDMAEWLRCAPDPEHRHHVARYMSADSVGPEVIDLLMAVETPLADVRRLAEPNPETIQCFAAHLIEALRRGRRSTDEEVGERVRAVGEMLTDLVATGLVPNNVMRHDLLDLAHSSRAEFSQGGIWIKRTSSPAQRAAYSVLLTLPALSESEMTELMVEANKDADLLLGLLRHPSIHQACLLFAARTCVRDVLQELSMMPAAVHDKAIRSMLLGTGNVEEIERVLEFCESDEERRKGWQRMLVWYKKQALDLLLAGNPEILRVAQHEDLAPFLEDANAEIRQDAILALSRLRSGTPEPAEPAGPEVSQKAATR